MASKKRGGLSKREFSAVSKAKVALKPAAKKSSSSGPKPGVYAPDFIGPVPTGSTYGKVYPDNFIGPIKNEDRRESQLNSSSGKSSSSKTKSSSSSKPSISSNRSLASQALNKITGINTAQASSDVDYSKTSLTPIKTRNIAGSLFRGATNLLGNAPFVGPAIRGLKGANVDISRSLGLDAGLFSRDSGLANFTDEAGQVLDVPGQQAMSDFQQVKETNPYADANRFVQSRNERNMRTASGSPLNDILGIKTARAEGPQGSQTPFNPNRYVPNEDFSMRGAALPFDPSTASEMGANDAVSSPPRDVAAPGTGRQTFGAGRFANGAGLQNNPAEDDYIKQLRKAYSGDGGMKELRKQFEELIKQLDPTYDALQKEGTQALNQNLLENSNQLASVMNAGNVGDSEQRTQQLAGLQQGNTTALGNLLAKLAQGKAADVSGYKSQLQGQLSDASQRNQTNQQKLLQLIQDYRSKGVAGGKSGGSGRAGTSSTSQDAQFEKTAKQLAQRVKNGQASREDAASTIRNMFPDYDENVIYDLVPDRLG